MNRDRPDPLDAEERALAAQLPRTRGRSEPTAEMDAQVLAAARAAPAGNPVRRARRWQAPAALAASLCLAIGLAWQSRQALTQHAQVDAATPAAGNEDFAVPMPAASRADPDTGQQTTPRPAVQPLNHADDLPFQPDAGVARTPWPRAATEQAPPRSEATPEAVEHAQALPASPPMDSTQPSAPPPTQAAVSAFPAEATGKPTGGNEQPASRPRPRDLMPESAEVRAPAAAAAPRPAMPAPALAPAPPPAPPTQDSTAKQALSAQGFGVVGQVAPENENENDEPPATMNSPFAREAWLRRISELVHEGHIEEARASLAEFRRRYPNERIPAALRDLERHPPH